MAVESIFPIPPCSKPTQLRPRSTIHRRRLVHPATAASLLKTTASMPRRSPLVRPLKLPLSLRKSNPNCQSSSQIFGRHGWSIATKLRQRLDLDILFNFSLEPIVSNATAIEQFANKWISFIDKMQPPRSAYANLHRWTPLPGHR